MFIDPFQNDCLAVLAERIAALTGQVNVYLLLDGVFVPGMYRTRPFTDGGASRVHLLFEALPGCTDEVKDASPFLVPIRHADGVLVDRLASRLAPCSGMPMVSAIATTESLDELGLRLAAWCVVQNDGQRFNFRYPDTRRLPGMYAALTPDQRAQMCGPMDFWSYIGRDGGWADLEVPKQESDIASDPVLDDAQFGRMVDDSAADEVLFRLVYGGFKPGGLHSVLYATVSSALATARAAGLGEDLIGEWCEYIIRNGRTLDSAAGITQWQASIADA